jgi:hypothetical protein
MSSTDASRWILFHHGTTKAAAKRIAEEGIKPIGGGQFGKGFYTSRDYDSALYYATARADGSHFGNWLKERKSAGLSTAPDVFHEDFKAGKTRGDDPQVVTVKMLESDYKALKTEYESDAQWTEDRPEPGPDVGCVVGPEAGLGGQHQQDDRGGGTQYAFKGPAIPLLTICPDRTDTQ